LPASGGTRLIRESCSIPKVREGLNAAAAVGDDRLQRMAGRSVNPETFTHSSLQQRMN
jgi:uncharacterized protein